jgi:hypothetical protein
MTTSVSMVSAASHSAAELVETTSDATAARKRRVTIILDEHFIVDIVLLNCGGNARTAGYGLTDLKIMDIEHERIYQ